MTTDETISIGSEVIGKDGNKLGSVDFVVVRPDTYEVTDLVVGTGWLLGRDILVPIAEVEGVRNGKVQLSLNKDQLDQHQDYIDVHYTAPPAGWIPPAGYLYPPSGVLWPVGAYYPEATSVTVNAPPGTMGISQGMEVRSSDGHKVGEVQKLEVDPRTDDVTDIVIQHGFIFHHDTTLPIQLVSGIREGTINLTLTQDQLKQQYEQS